MKTFPVSLIFFGIFSMFGKLEAVTVRNYSTVACGVEIRDKINPYEVDYPWVVEIRSSFDDTPVCIGTILSAHSVLIAAHCLCEKVTHAYRPVNEFIGYAGAVEAKNTQQAETILFDTVSVYPEHDCTNIGKKDVKLYSESAYYGDYALLHAANGIPWISGIAPACILEYPVGVLEKKPVSDECQPNNPDRNEFTCYATSNEGIDDCVGVLQGPVIIRDDDVGVYGVVGITTIPTSSCTSRFTPPDYFLSALAWLVQTIEQYEDAGLDNDDGN